MQKPSHVECFERVYPALMHSLRASPLLVSIDYARAFLGNYTSRNLTKSLSQPLSHRRLVGDLYIVYRYLHGNCSQEIRIIIYFPLRRVRTNRSSTFHPFHVSLPTPLTLPHKLSFIPRTGNLWNVLPSSSFPESSCKLPSFKSKINKLDLISLSS